MTLPIDRNLIAIDPGTTKSAVLVWHGNVINKMTGEYENSDVFKVLEVASDYNIACEGIASYGMAVGKETFDTCIWIGRFMERWEGLQVTARLPKPFTILYRPDVKMTLCHSMRAKDANVRQALLDIFPATGGGSTPQVGTKAQPGPLYGVSKHVWSALAVGVTYCIKNPMK